MVEIDTIEQVMRALKDVSGLTYVHAESNQLVEAAQAEAVAAGRIHAAGMARASAAVDEVIAARQCGVRAFSG